MEDRLGVTGAVVGVREVSYAPGRRMGWHRHGLASVTLVLRGEIEEWSGDGVRVGGACAVFFKPVGVEHSNRVGASGARTLSLTLGDGGAWSGLGYGVVRDAGCVSAVLRLASESGDRRLAGAASAGLIEAMGRSMADGDGGWVAGVRERIESGEEGCGQLARASGIHPASLARAFRRRYGESAAGYRRRRRVLEAAARVMEGEGSLAGVACGAGFADQSHMTREFRRELGVTPGALRAMAGG